MPSADNFQSFSRTQKRNKHFPTFGQTQVSLTRYKTELCRPFTETGICKYGDKCQFSHGTSELRILIRHPKYKTEYCRTFHSTGYCPYGPRCHFIHDIHEARSPAPATSSTTIQQNSTFNKANPKAHLFSEQPSHFSFTLEDLNRALSSFDLNEQFPVEHCSSSSSSTNSSLS